MMISEKYPTIPLMVEMRFQNPKTSLFGNYLGTQCASCHRKIPSAQNSENQSQQLNFPLCECNPDIPSVRHSILSPRRRIIISLHYRHPRRYLITRFNDWIWQLMNKFTRGWIQPMPVSNRCYGKLQICGDMSHVLKTWQASLSAWNEWPRQPFQAFRQWWRHTWSLQLSIMQCW